MSWPASPPPWLEAWALWYLRGRSLPRPPAPSPIPAVGWQFQQFCLWRHRGGLPADRPPGLWSPVPAWVWTSCKRVLAQWVVPPAPPVVTGSWRLPDPLIFTAWGWQNGTFDPPMVAALGATKGTVAFQLGQGTAAQARAVREAGAHVAGWGVSDPARDFAWLEDIAAEGYMPQIEGPGQWSAACAALDGGAGKGLSLGAVCITTPPDQVAALVERGVTSAYFECYGPEGWPFYDLPRCLWQARQDGWPVARPAIGLYHDWTLAQYDLTPYGRAFGFWLAEEAVPSDWPKLAAP